MYLYSVHCTLYIDVSHQEQQSRAAAGAQESLGRAQCGEAYTDYRHIYRQIYTQITDKYLLWTIVENWVQGYPNYNISSTNTAIVMNGLISPDGGVAKKRVCAQLATQACF